jgi:hypothetical protein
MRTTPFALAFGTDAEERFARLRASLAAAGLDAEDRDAFVLDREVVSFLRDLVPEGVGEAVSQHVALLHHAYLYWSEGGWIVRPSRARMKELLAEPGSALPAVADPGVPRAWYVQLPERLVWAELAPGEPHEPMDGLFVRSWPGGGYFVLAIFGLHPGRTTFSVVDADGYPTEDLVRADDSPLFAPVLPGGVAAGLHSIVGEEELLELARRTALLAGEAVACAGRQHRAHAPVEIG